MQEVTFSEETIKKIRDIFHELPADGQQNKETEKYLREIASELKKIRTELGRR